MEYHIFGTKGGVGTTTVAAALALRLSVAAPTLINADADHDDLLAVLGIGTSPIDVASGTEVAPNLFWRASGDVPCRDQVIDHGTDLSRAADLPVIGAVRLLVTRPCYIAFRRFYRSFVGASHFDGIVLLGEPGRALGAHEASDVLDLPVLTTIPVDATIARAIDAGVLRSTQPALLQHGIDRLIKATKAQYASR